MSTVRARAAAPFVTGALIACDEARPEAEGQRAPSAYVAEPAGGDVRRYSGTITSTSPNSHSNNSRITLSGIVIIVLIGVTSFLSFPRAEDPSITIREVSVTASFPRTPHRVEELVTKPLEQAMREIAEIKDIESTSKTGATKLKLRYL